MSYGRTKVGRLRAYVEPNGSFAQDGTGTMASFADVRWMEADPTTTLARLADERVRSYVWEKTVEQFGFKSLSFEMKGHLVSSGTELGAAASPTQDVLSKVLGALCGGYTAAAGSLVASGASSTGVTVTAGQGTRFIPGTIAWIETGLGTGLYVPTRIKTQATDALTFGIAVGFTPAVGAKVLNSYMHYPGTVLSGSNTSLQWLYESEAAAGETFLLMGCQGDLKIDWTLGADVTWASSQKGVKWLKGASLATPTTGLAAATHTGSSPIPATAGGIVFTPASGTTRTLPQISKMEVALGVNWTPVPTFNGVEGVGEWALTPGDCTAMFELPYIDQTYMTARDAGTLYQALAQAGNVGGAQLALDLPNLQIVDVQPFRQNGMSYQRVTCNALLDANTTDQTTDQRRACWRLARG